MYFNQNNSFYHGIMFHHFHDDKLHLKSQGSITKDQFYKLINYIGFIGTVLKSRFTVK